MKIGNKSFVSPRMMMLFNLQGRGVPKHFRAQFLNFTGSSVYISPPQNSLRREAPLLFSQIRYSVHILVSFKSQHVRQSWIFHLALLGSKKKSKYILFQPCICSTQNNAYIFKKAPGQSYNVLILTEYALQVHVMVSDSI